MVIMCSVKCDDIAMNMKRPCSNSGVLVSVLYALKRLSVLGAIGTWLASICCVALGQVDGAPIMISSLAELDQLTILDERLVAAVHIEGTVWWSSKTEGRVILNDETATLQLELDLPCQMPALGDRLILEGECTATKTRDVIKLSGVPVVDHDGLHPPEEKAGTIYLKTGRHPVLVAWFDRTDRYGLKVSYEGPDLPRQQIPDEALFRLEVDEETGKTNFVSGLDYRCYEGAWWRRLPNFNHIAAVKTGVVDNFDIAVRSRTNQVGLQFSGYIKVPRDGEYTFYVWSDDGSCLFIGESSLRILTRGRVELPLPGQWIMEGVPKAAPELQRSAIEGVVTSFHHLQGALEVDLMTEEGPVILKLAEDSGCSYTLRPENRIRAVGVSRRTFGLDGQFTRSEFYVQRWNDVEQLYITPAIWVEYPLNKIGNLLTSEPSNIVDSVVHLNGKISSMGVGQPMVLEDETGRMIMNDSVPDEFVGHSLDVLGLLSLEGSDWVLRCIQINQSRVPEAEANSLPVLTTALQVSQLSLEEAARGYPVRLKGVITSPNEHDGAVMQDSSQGIYLWLPRPNDVAAENWTPIALQSGDYCEIEGVTQPYLFNPYIQVLRLQKLGVAALPAPVRPTWDQLINGSMHCKYVELEGVVTSIKDSTIDLLTRDGHINLQLNPIGPAMPPDSLGATIRLRGALLADWDGESRRVVLGSIYLDQHRVAVVHPAPVDPFAIPLKKAGDLLRFDPDAGALQRVKVSGVLLHNDVQIAYLMDGGNGLRFMPVEAVAAQVGERVEVVGFTDLSGPSPLLRDAVTRRVGPSEELSPRKLKAGELLRDEYDSTLVQVDGVLSSVGRWQEGSVLEMQSGLRRFLAILDDPESFDELPAPGSHLELTGVFVGQGGNPVLGRPIDSFQLHLHSARDIRVLTRPSWWTFQRLMLVVGLLIMVLSAALVWINLLHRKVEQRTQQLGDQIRHRQRAEHQREIEHERSRLANDLHDDLGAGLTEVNMLSSLVKSPSTPAADRERYADEMTELALRMVTSLDEIVWAENPRNDTIASLAGYFGAYAQRVLELASVGCGLDVAEDLPDYPLDPRFRRELFLAFKEALTNVIQHASATKVGLRISIQDEKLVVTVSDDGCGIVPDTREAGADGLANMQQRLTALNGNCEIQSDPGKGTTVCLKAPIHEVEI